MNSVKKNLVGAKEVIKDILIEFIVLLYCLNLLTLFLIKQVDFTQTCTLLIVTDIFRLIQWKYDKNTKLQKYYYIETFIYILFKLFLALISYFGWRLYLVTCIFTSMLFFIRLFIYCCNSAIITSQYDLIFQLFNVLWKTIVMIESLMVALKLDGYLDWKWTQIFWVYLIVIVINSLMTSIILLYFFAKVLPDSLSKQNKPLMAAFLQMILYEESYFTIHYFVYQTYNDMTQFSILVIIFTFFNIIVQLIFTYNQRHNLIQFYYNLFIQIDNNNEEVEDNPQSRQQQSKSILKRISANYYRPIHTRIQTYNFTTNNNNQDLNSSQVSEEQKLCIICQDKFGDKIFMPCGHGRFCGSCICATDVCFLCRNPIDHVCTIKNEDKNVLAVINT